MDNPKKQSMESAPKDGTLIKLQNSKMSWAQLGRWGEFTCPHLGITATDWHSVFDPNDSFNSMGSNRLICPEWWYPA